MSASSSQDIRPAEVIASSSSDSRAVEANADGNFDTGAVLFNCKVCKKKFKSVKGLEKHCRAHRSSGEDNFKSCYLFVLL